MSPEDRDAFAFARRGEDDTELLALSEKHASITSECAALADDEDDRRERLWDCLNNIEGRINQIRPSTLKGVLTVLQLAVDVGCDYPDPDLTATSLAALREIVERAGGR
jgi:hypothetical protein